MGSVIAFLFSLIFAPAAASVPCPGGVQTNCISPYYNQVNMLGLVNQGPTTPGNWTTSTRPAGTPALGTFGLNTTIGGFEYWNGSAWTPWGGGGGGGSVTWPTSGQVVISNGTNSPASLPYANISPGSAVIVETGGAGTLHPSFLPLATTSLFGAVKPDGTSITISGGIISAAAGSLPTASTSVLGGVKIDGTSITINGSGVISAPGAGGGSVTSITCGTGLSGGVITTTGTCGIANTGVSAGSYVNPLVTFNAQGQASSAANGPGVDWVDCVTQYGVDNTGATPASTNNTAIVNCLTAAAGGTAYFPHGDYNYTSFSAGATQNTTIRGAGLFATRFHPGTSTSTITLNSAHGLLRDIGIYDDATTQTSGDLVYVNAGGVSLEDIQIYAASGKSFYNGIHIDATNGVLWYVNNFQISGVSSGATNVALQVGEPSSTNQNVGGVASNGNIGYAHEGILVYSSGGATFQSIDIINSTDHAVATLPASGSHIFALVFQNVQGDTSTNDNWYFGTNGGDVGNVTLNNCWGSSSLTGSGLSITGLAANKVNGISVNGGQFIFNNKFGIVNSNGKNFLVNGALVMGNSQAGSNSYAGIAIGANVTNFVITNNISQYGGYLENFGAPNNQSYGVQVASGASDYYIVSGNLGQNNVSGNVNDGGTGAHKYLAGNIP